MTRPPRQRKRDPFKRAVLAPRLKPAIPRCEPCDKLSYSNQSQAAVFASRCTERGAPPLRIYKCPKGNGFHLTSMPKQEAS